MWSSDVSFGQQVGACNPRRPTGVDRRTTCTQRWRTGRRFDRDEVSQSWLASWITSAGQSASASTGGSGGMPWPLWRLECWSVWGGWEGRASVAFLWQAKKPIVVFFPSHLLRNKTKHFKHNYSLFTAGLWYPTSNVFGQLCAAVLLRLVDHDRRSRVLPNPGRDEPRLPHLWCLLYAGLLHVSGLVS